MPYTISAEESRRFNVSRALEILPDAPDAEKVWGVRTLAGQARMTLPDEFTSNPSDALSRLQEAYRTNSIEPLQTDDYKETEQLLRDGNWDELAKRGAKSDTYSVKAGDRAMVANDEDVALLDEKDQTRFRDLQKRVKDLSTFDTWQDTGLDVRSREYADRYAQNERDLREAEGQFNALLNEARKRGAAMRHVQRVRQKNAFTLLNSISGDLDDRTREIVDRAVANGYRLADGDEDAFALPEERGGLPESQKELAASFLLYCKPVEGKGAWDAFLKRMGDNAAKVVGNTASGVGDLFSGVFHGFDKDSYRDRVNRRAWINRINARNFADLGTLGNSFAEAGGIIGYWTPQLIGGAVGRGTRLLAGANRLGAVARVAGKAAGVTDFINRWGPEAMYFADYRQQFLERVALDGGDVTNPAFQVAATVGAAASAYVEHIQWGRAMGKVGLEEVQAQAYAKLSHRILAKLGIKVGTEFGSMTAGRAARLVLMERGLSAVTEGFEEAIQQAIEETVVQIGDGKGFRLADIADQSGEAFVSTLGPMMWTMMFGLPFRAKSAATMHNLDGDAIDRLMSASSRLKRLAAAGKLDQGGDDLASLNELLFVTSRAPNADAGVRSLRERGFSQAQATDIWNTFETIRREAIQHGQMDALGRNVLPTGEELRRTGWTVNPDMTASRMVETADGRKRRQTIKVRTEASQAVDIGDDNQAVSMLNTIRQEVAGRTAPSVSEDGTPGVIPLADKIAATYGFDLSLDNEAILANPAMREGLARYAADNDLRIAGNTRLVETRKAKGTDGAEIDEDVFDVTLTEKATRRTIFHEVAHAVAATLRNMGLSEKEIDAIQNWRSGLDGKAPSEAYLALPQVAGEAWDEERVGDELGDLITEPDGRGRVAKAMNFIGDMTRRILGIQKQQNELHDAVSVLRAAVERGFFGNIDDLNDAQRRVLLAARQKRAEDREKRKAEPPAPAPAEGAVIAPAPPEEETNTSEIQTGSESQTDSESETPPTEEPKSVLDRAIDAFCTNRPLQSDEMAALAASGEVTQDEIYETGYRWHFAANAWAISPEAVGRKFVPSRRYMGLDGQMHDAADFAGDASFDFGENALTTDEHLEALEQEMPEEFDRYQVEGNQSWGDENQQVVIVGDGKPEYIYRTGRKLKEAKPELYSAAVADLEAQPNHIMDPEHPDLHALQIDGKVIRITRAGLFHGADRRLKANGNAIVKIGSILNASIEVPGVQTPWHFRIAAVNFGGPGYVLVTSREAGAVLEEEIESLYAINVKEADAARVATPTNTNLPTPVTIADLKAAWQAIFLHGLETHGINFQSAGSQAESSGRPQVAARVPTADELSEAQRQYDDVVAKFRGTDKWLKAPNGAETHLTERQWVQVRTPAFKAWFGDWENDPANASKVVDENGEPRVVYHGTGAKFTVFGQSERAKERTFWFAENADYANEFTRFGGNTPNVMRIFLNIRNPFDLRTEPFLGHLVIDAKNVGSEEGGYAYQDDIDAIAEIMGMTAEDVLEKFDGKSVFEVLESRDFSDRLTERGFDGIESEEDDESTWAAFDPAQIKSAADNVGTFSGANQDIRYQVAPKVTPMTDDEVARAVEMFGTTDDPNNAAYILPDGRWLDMDQLGEHWEISQAFTAKHKKEADKAAEDSEFYGDAEPYVASALGAGLVRTTGGVFKNGSLVETGIQFKRIPGAETVGHVERFLEAVRAKNPGLERISVDGLGLDGRWSRQYGADEADAAIRDIRQYAATGTEPRESLVARFHGERYAVASRRPSPEALDAFMQERGFTPAYHGTIGKWRKPKFGNPHGVDAFYLSADRGPAESYAALRSLDTDEQEKPKVRKFYVRADKVKEFADDGKGPEAFGKMLEQAKADGFDAVLATGILDDQHFRLAKDGSIVYPEEEFDDAAPANVWVVFNPDAIVGEAEARRQYAAENKQVSPEFAMDGTIADGLPAHLREDARAIIAERANTPAWMADPDGTPTDLNERDWLRREAERRHNAPRFVVKQKKAGEPNGNLVAVHFVGMDRYFSMIDAGGKLVAPSIAVSDADSPRYWGAGVNWAEPDSGVVLVMKPEALDNADGNVDIFGDDAGTPMVQMLDDENITDPAKAVEALKEFRGGEIDNVLQGFRTFDVTTDDAFNLALALRMRKQPGFTAKMRRAVAEPYDVKTGNDLKKSVAEILKLGNEYGSAAMNVLLDAGENNLNKKEIQKRLAKKSIGRKPASFAKAAQAILDVLDTIDQEPRGYLEAKVYRAVPLTDVAVAIVNEEDAGELVDDLETRGVQKVVVARSKDEVDAAIKQYAPRFQVASTAGAQRLGIRNLADAEAMERSGASRLDIWRETGWWRGTDDRKWRVEVGDIRIKDDAFNRLRNRNAKVKPKYNADNLPTPEEIEDDPELVDGIELELVAHLAAETTKYDRIHGFTQFVKDEKEPGGIRFLSFDESYDLHLKEWAEKHPELYAILQDAEMLDGPGGIKDSVSRIATQIKRGDITRGTTKNRARMWWTNYAKKQAVPQTLGELVEGPILDAYPELRNIRIVPWGKSVRNSYAGEAGTNHIAIRMEERGGIKYGHRVVRETLAHEIAHQVQRIEGLTRGSSPERERRNLDRDNTQRARESRTLSAENDLTSTLLRIGIGILERTGKPIDVNAIMAQVERAAATDRPDVGRIVDDIVSGLGENDATQDDAERIYDKVMAFVQAKQQEIHPPSEAELLDDAREAYMAAGGEVEARMVEARLDLTDEQKNEIPPWVTEAVVRQDLYGERSDYSYAAQRAMMGRMAADSIGPEEREKGGRAAVAGRVRAFDDEPRYSPRASLAAVATMELLAGREPDRDALEQMRTRLDLEADVEEVIGEAKTMLDSAVGEIARRGASRNPRAVAVAIAESVQGNHPEDLVQEAFRAGANAQKWAQGTRGAALNALVRNARGDNYADLVMETGVDATGVLQSFPDMVRRRRADRQEPAPAPAGERPDEATEAKPAATGEAPSLADIGPIDPNSPEGRRIAAIQEGQEANIEKALRETEKEMEQRRLDDWLENADKRDKEAAKSAKDDVDEDGDGGDGDLDESDESGVSDAIRIPVEVLERNLVDVSDPETFTLWLRKVVRNRILKANGLSTDFPDLAAAQAAERDLWANPTNVAAFAKSMSAILRDMARRMLDHRSGAYTEVLRKAATLPHYDNVDAIEDEVAFEVRVMSGASISQTSAQLVNETRRKLKRDFIGATKPNEHPELQDDLVRKITGRVRKMAMWYRNVLALTEGEVEKMRETLEARLEERGRNLDEAGMTEKADRENDAVWDWTNWKLSVLDRFGGTRYLLPSEARERCGEIQTWMAKEGMAWAQKMEAITRQYEQDRKTIIEGCRVTDKAGRTVKHEEDTKLDKAWRFFVNSIDQRLRLLFARAGGEAGRAAKELRDKTAARLFDATTRYKREKQEMHLALVLSVRNVVGERGVRNWLKRMKQEIPEEQAIALSKQNNRHLTYGQVMHLYGYLRQTATYGENIAKYGREEQRDYIERNVLTAEDIKILDGMMQIYADNRRALDEASRDLTGFPIRNPDPFYLPVKIKQKARSGLETTVSTVQAMPAVFSERRRHGLDVDEKADIMVMFYDRMEQTARVLGMGRTGLDIIHTFGASDVKEAITEARGAKFTTALIAQFTDWMNGDKARLKNKNGEDAEVLNQMRTAFVYMALWGNTLTAFKQTLSAPVFSLAKEVGERGMLRNMMGIFSDGWKQAKIELTQSDPWKARYGDVGLMQETEEAVKGSGDGTIWQAILRAGMQPLQWGDATPAILCQVTEYMVERDRLIEGGMQPEEAKRRAATKAMMGVEGTQQSSRPEYLPEFSRRGSSAFRMMTMFASSPMLQAGWQVQRHIEYREKCDAFGKDSKEAQEALAALWRARIVNHVVMPVLFQTATAIFNLALGKEPPDEKDALELIFSMLSGPFARVVFWGGMAKSIYDVYAGTGSFAHSQVAPSMLTSLEQSGKILFGEIPIDIFNGDMDEALADIDKFLKLNVAPYRHGRQAYENWSD